MSGRDPQSIQSPGSPSPGLDRVKLRLLLPIALAVAGLSLFLVAFWPSSHHGETASHHAQSAGKNFSPVGGSDKGGNEGRGNLSVNSEDGPRSGDESPVGGENSRADGKSKQGNWWFQDKAKPAREKEREYSWWYQEKPADVPARPREQVTEGNAVGEHKHTVETTPKNSGPDNNWWHD